MKLVLKSLCATVLLIFFSSAASVAVPPQEDLWDHGTIDWMDEEKIVIDDTEFGISDGTVYRDGKDVQTNASYLEQGMKVEFQANDEFQIVIIRELLDPDAADRDQGYTASQDEVNVDTAPASMDAPEGIYQEGGVWKN